MSNNTLSYKQSMQPWPAIAQYARMVNLQTLNLNLFYYQAGFHHKQQIVMLHGLGDEADTWRHVLLPLSEDYQTLAIDLPGFGRSDQPNVKYTPQYLSNAVIAFMDQLHITSAILMGSSLGAMLAQAMAISHPDRIDGLILVGGGLVQAEPIQDWRIKMMATPFLGEWLYSRLRKDPQAAFETLHSVYHQLEKLPKADREFLFTRVNQRVWSDGQRRAYLSTLRNIAAWIKKYQPNLPEQLQQVSCPTLIIRGEHDQLFTERNADEILKTQPNTEKAIILNVGHLPHQEALQQFIDLTRSWLIKNF